MKKAQYLISIMCCLPFTALAHEAHLCPEGFPDSPVLSGHIEQRDITNDELRFKQIVDAGEKLFVSNFNICDGQGRPASTGTGEKRIADEARFIRTSAPEANSCAGCHAQPRAGGGGDFVANVFVLAQALDPVIDSVDSEFSNERNTLGMFGAGAIEMLAREMSQDLLQQVVNLSDGEHILTSKGVEFNITIHNGEVVESKGVDTDLIIKPFHQAGVVTSIREFTVNAFNHHHGMQAEERFDLNPDKGFDSDFDEDGVHRELTVGDITAAVIWQASLAVPGQVLPENKYEQRLVRRGERLFHEMACTSCHIPKVRLESREFIEPNPFNPEGTCSDEAVCSKFSFDMTREGKRPLLERDRNRGAIIRAYTDLKRHNLCDPVGTPDAIRFYCNEKLAQGRPDEGGHSGTEYFLTRKLWDVGNSSPYGHRGDLTTITEAILVHGGEARESRDRFASDDVENQQAVIKFLKTLQILPEGSPRVIIADKKNKRRRLKHED